MIRNHARYWLPITVLTAVAATLASESQASRFVNASSGHNFLFDDPAHMGCLSDNGGAFINTCSATQNLLVPLPIDNTGTKTLMVWGMAGSFSNLSCNAVGVTPDGSTFTSSTTTQWAVGAFPRPFQSSPNLTGLSVPSNGYMWLSCVMPQGSEVASIVYNQ